MPRPCSICAHLNRAIIDAALEAGQSLRTVAGQFAVSKSSVDRHQKHCLTPSQSTAAVAPVTDTPQPPAVVAQTSSPRLSREAQQALAAYRTAVHEYQLKQQPRQGWLAQDRTSIMVQLQQRVEHARQRLAALGINPEALRGR
jgi:hypothetical protein